MGEKANEWLTSVVKQFREAAGSSHSITLDAFKQVFENKESPYVPRIFELFDKDRSGSVSLGELIDGLHLMVNGSQKEKLQFLFDVIDLNGDGKIDLEELDTILSSSLADASISITDEDYTRLIENFISETDTDDDGAITYDELLAQFQKYPQLFENLSLNIHGLITVSRSGPDERGKLISCNLFYTPTKFISWSRNRNNRSKLVLLCAFLLINLVLFLEAAYKWRSKGSNWYLVIARGNGACLNFNCSIVVVFVLRKFITYVRSSFLAKYIQIDENIDIHRYIGYVIGVQALCHTIAHVGNADAIAQASDGKITVIEVLLTNPHLTQLGHPWVAGTAFLSGWALDIILVIMIGFSMNCIRRTGHFQVFYVSHLLYYVFWLLLFLHGPRFWKFFLLPAALFFYEKVLNMEVIRTAVYGGKSYIKEANLLSSRVTHLKITRPPNFDYEPGDYVFIKIPALTAFEWHPFTISSAPEEKGTFSLHVRSIGNWTHGLYDFIANQIQDENLNYITQSLTQADKRRSWSASKPPSLKSRRSLRASSQSKPILSRKCSKIKEFDDQVENNKRLLQVSIEGPYGTPTRAIFNADHAVLIGAGIGVTPFASILQSIMYRYRLSKQTCPNCKYCWMEDLPATLMELKKVNFIWINRHHKSFEWFVGLLAQMELEQDQEDFEKFLDMKMYMTKELHKDDMRGIALQMALQTMHTKTQKDLLTGLKTRLQSGRPDWDKVFSNIDKDARGCVEVFFCGAPALGEVLKKYCAKYNFVFHKESF